MKRYTGQKALYEAISRSRAKAKQGSILERLRPEPTTPEHPASQPPAPPEPEPSVEPDAQDSVEPQGVETPPEPVVEEQPQAEAVEVPSEPVDQFDSSVTVRPIERFALAAPAPGQAWLRPRPVQLNEGRIEISVPYYVGVVAGLALLVVVLAAYRLGQGGSGGQVNEAPRPAQPVADRSAPAANPPAASTQRSAATDVSRLPANPPAPAGARQDAAPAAVQGDHWFVLARYNDSKDLEPVVKHFAQYGIELGIMALDAESRKVFAELGYNPSVLPTNAKFLLVTRTFYNNPTTPGTEGYAMKNKITEVGALYKGKAPTGYETFAPNYFSDAYAMKIR